MGFRIPSLLRTNIKILITGGSGMLGLNILKAFGGTDHTILAPTRPELNCSNLLSLKSYLSVQRPEMVIHCAGLVGGISANIESPYLFFKENMLMGINVMDACIDAGVSRLINISSTNLYPAAQVQGGFNETDILAGKLSTSTEGYGLAKGCTAKLAEYASKQFGVAYSSIILSNLYGEFDNFSDGRAHMIPAIINRLHTAKVQGARVVEIWGDGSARRGFLFAEDVSSFITHLIDNNKAIPQNINVVPLRDYSVFEYNKIIAKIVGYTGEFRFNTSMPEGTKKIEVNGKVASSLGWAEITPIEQGISKTYNYFLQGTNK